MRKAIFFTIAITFFSCSNSNSNNLSLEGVWWFIDSDSAYYEIYYNETDTLFDIIGEERGYFPESQLKYDRKKANLEIYSLQYKVFDFELISSNSEKIYVKANYNNEIILCRINNILYNKNVVNNSYYIKNYEAFSKRKWQNRNGISF